MHRRLAEFLTTVLIFCATAAALALHSGSFGLSWYALNHHIYLGFIADSPRWHLDVAAASSQTYQYPYLYWPFYRLTLMGLSGAKAAALWAVFQTLCVVPAVWLASLRLLGGERDDWESRLHRFIACLLAFVSILVMAAVGGSANDLLAATPLLWAIVLALSPAATFQRVALCSFLVGLAVAFKVSNLVCLPLFLFALLDLPIRRIWIIRVAVAAVASVAGFTVAYAPWGWQLWKQFGNPIYPYFDTFFRS